MNETTTGAADVAAPIPSAPIRDLADNPAQAGADAPCGDCGHLRSEHDSRLPGVCLHGWNSSAMNYGDPGYGCGCIGWTPVREAARDRKTDRYAEAANYIRRTVRPGDVGGMMVMAALLKDVIDHEADGEIPDAS